MTDENHEKGLSEEELKAQKERRARNKLRRQKLLEEQRIKEEKQARKIRRLVFSSIFWLLLILLCAGAYLSVKNGIAADFLTHQGQKYIEIEEYDKALNMLKTAENMSPDDENIVYYQVIALSRQPINYNTLKSLYEISQYDDFDEASEYAYRTLVQIREQIDKQVGSNYIYDVMYDGIVFRWNNKKPINYAISSDGSIPYSYMNEIKKAFTAWSSLSNGNILFNKVNNIEEADIVIMTADTLPNIKTDDTLRSAVVVPVITDNVLNRVDIILKLSDVLTRNEDNARFATFMKAQIGHALGIGGYSFDEQDVMHSSSDYISKVTPYKTFTVRDFNTITFLYKMVPDVINEPILPEDYNDLFFHNAITSIPGDDIDQKMKKLMKYLDENPQDIPKWVDLASNYSSKKRYKHSNAILKNLFHLVKDDTENCFVVLYNIAVNYYKMKDYSTAAKYIKAARRYNNTDLDALIVETFIGLKSEDKEQALKKLENINKKYPDNIEVALKLAYIYRKNKEFDKVSTIINNLLNSNTNARFDKRIAKYLRIY